MEPKRYEQIAFALADKSAIIPAIPIEAARIITVETSW